MLTNHAWRRLLGLIILVILVSPLLYWSTGIGQTAASLPAELGRLPDGTPVSSLRAEAHHRLMLPMSIQRMLIYPLLLLAFQLSGGAVALRNWLEQRVQPRLARLPLPGWFSNLISRLPSSWRERLPLADLLVILLFITVFNVGLFSLYLPFNFYRSFIVGHQFELVTQTAGMWLADWGKNVGIRLALDGLLWTGFFALMRLLPRRWPLPGGALLVAVSLAFSLLAPLVVTPLFYNVSVLDDAGLATRIRTLAERAGMPVDEVFVIDASRKTATVNAFVTGFGEAQRIVVYDTLLADYTADEVEVVLAHELGHWVYHHVLLSVLGLGAVGWLGLFGLRWLLDHTWLRLGLRGPADVAGWPFILAVFALASLLTMPVENGISRYAERQADEFALRVSEKPEAFIALFEGLAAQNLSIVQPAAWEEFIFYTHPPIVERLQMAREFEE